MVTPKAGTSSSLLIVQVRKALLNTVDNPVVWTTQV